MTVSAQLKLLAGNSKTSWYWTHFLIGKHVCTKSVTLSFLFFTGNPDLG